MKELVVSAVAILPLLGGCHSLQITDISDRTYPPRPEVHPVQIFLGTPERKHVPIAYVSGREVAWAGQASGDKVIDEMKKIARQKGGDAIISLKIYTAPDGAVSQGNTTVQGTIVRWAE